MEGKEGSKNVSTKSRLRDNFKKKFSRNRRGKNDR